jgi:hypothetical protein
VGRWKWEDGSGDLYFLIEKDKTSIDVHYFFETRNKTFFFGLPASHSRDSSSLQSSE